MVGCHARRQDYHSEHARHELCRRSISHVARAYIYFSISLITLFISSVVMAGWSAFIPGVVLMVLGGFLGRVYLIAQIGIRREMSNAKAPVMSQISTVLGGISGCIYPFFSYV